MATSKSNPEHSDRVKELRNEDPISGEAGAHPVGSGLGAAVGGAAAGAAAGLAAGPVGTVVGAVAGGVIGGLAGKAIAENVDPTIETEYWRNEYANRPYYDDSYDYDEYEPAYRTGWEAYDNTKPATFAEREGVMRHQWETGTNAATMSWDQARPAAEDAYNRVHSARIRKAK